MKKCNYMNRVRSFAEREAGCPLDHCSCGTHDANNEEHGCPEDDYSGHDDEVRDAERRAGWDPNP